MSKRDPVDMKALMTLTTDTAVPMREAIQRSPSSERDEQQIGSKSSRKTQEAEEERTENLVALNFKVPRSFRKRYRQSAAGADLKHIELLFEAFDAWLEKKGSKL